MEENKVPTIKYAMHYGAILGLFWMFKYLFRIGAGFSDHVFIYVFYVLNVGTFLLIYIFTFKFKQSDAEKPRGILGCILFVVLICFFASFFEAVIMYAHFKFIDPGYFLKMTAPYIDMINSMPSLSLAYKELWRDIFSNKLVYIVLNFMGNTFLGLMLGLLMGLLVNAGRRQS